MKNRLKSGSTFSFFCFLIRLRLFRPILFELNHDQYCVFMLIAEELINWKCVVSCMFYEFFSKKKKKKTSPIFWNTQVHREFFRGDQQNWSK